MEIVEQSETEIVEGRLCGQEEARADEETKKLLALRYEMSHDRIASSGRSGSASPPR